MNGRRLNGVGMAVAQAAALATVQDATRRLEQAKAEGEGYGPGQGANAGAIQVGHENGQVLIVFDKPVGYAGLPPEAAVELAIQLVGHATAAGFPHPVELLVGLRADQLHQQQEQQRLESPGSLETAVGWVDCGACPHAGGCLDVCEKKAPAAGTAEG